MYRSYRSVQFIVREYGLDPGDVHAAVLERLSLLEKGLFRLRDSPRTEWFQDVADRTDVSGDDDRSVCAICNFAGDSCRGKVEFANPMRKFMEGQPNAICAERIREQDVGASFYEALVNTFHEIRIIHVPNFFGGSLIETQLKKFCPHGAVRNHDLFLIK